MYLNFLENNINTLRKNNMIDCNVYILTDKENKLVKIGISKNHPSLRATTINKSTDDYNFSLYSFITVKLKSARYIETFMLSVLDGLGGKWLDEEFDGVTETRKFDISDIEALLELLDIKLQKIASQDFKDTSLAVELSKEVFPIEYSILQARYIKNNTTGDVIEVDANNKIVYSYLKIYPETQQDTLATSCGISRHTVIRMINKLVEVGVVEKNKTRASNGATYNNYVVHDLDDTKFSCYK